MRLLIFKILWVVGFLGLANITLGQPDIQEIDTYLAKARNDWQIPGMAVAIVKDGEVVLKKGYGVKEAGENHPVNPNTLFAIASNTKAFVASALANLVSEGKISWEDRVKDYIPYLQLYNAYVTEEIRIKDLLCHRAGLGTFSGDLMWYKSNLTIEEIIQKIEFVPQAYGFRNGYGYSNLMYIVAGEVIKSVTGKSWDEYIHETFLQPLGMERTITSTNDLREKGNFAMPHKPYENGIEVIDWVNWDQMGAAGGIISSVSDMSTWLNMNLNNGIWNEDTLINPEQQNILWTPHNNHIITRKARENLPGIHFRAYGLGWQISDYFGNKIVTHGGGYDGMYSRVMMVPDQNLGMVILTNSMKGISTPLCYYILNQYLQKDLRDWSAEALVKSRANRSQAEAEESRKIERKKKIKPIYNPEEYAGTYESGLHGKILIKTSGDDLRMTFEEHPGLSATLKHWHYEVWEISWDQTHAWFDFGTVQFLLDNNLNVRGLHFDVPNYDIFFDEVDLKKIK